MFSISFHVLAELLQFGSLPTRVDAKSVQASPFPHPPFPLKRQTTVVMVVYPRQNVRPSANFRTPLLTEMHANQ